MATVINKTTMLVKRRVDPSKYNTSDWIIDPIFPDTPSHYWKIDGDQVVEKSQAEKDAYDAQKSAHNLSAAQMKKNRKIDAKTDELIGQGFSFDGETFSLSTNAQASWNAIQTAVAGGLLTEANFPYELSTKDDGIYNLAWANVGLFMGTALTTVSTHLATGRALKKLVVDATTVAEVEAIVDNR